MIDEIWLQLIFNRSGPWIDWPAEVYRQTEPTAATAQKLSAAFERSPEWAPACTDKELNEAFWFLSSNAFLLVRDEAIPWPLRHRFIRSFVPLFEQLFAVRCGQSLGHLSEVDSDLNPACYMWWDFDCWSAIPDPLTRNPQDAAFLETMERILRIPHVACQESALHGLGHWRHAHPLRVEQIIDDFLQRERALRPELAAYAKSARCGCVL